MNGISTVHAAILLAAVIVFALATWQFASPAWNRIVSLGLALFALSCLISC